MMNKNLKRLIAFTSVSAAVGLYSASVSAADYNAQILNVYSNNGVLSSAQVKLNSNESGTFYAAVYENGKLIGIDSAELDSTGKVQLNGSLSYDSSSQTLKCFIWDNYEPISDVYSGDVTPEGSATESPSETDAPTTSPDVTSAPTSSPDATTAPTSSPDATTAPTTSPDTTTAPTSSPDVTTAPTSSPDATDEPSEEGYKADFITDGHASISVSNTQDFSSVTDNASYAYARDSESGEILTDGNGQINFKVNLDDGYEIDSVTAEPSSNYKNLKDLSDSAYRVTKITGDITITVTTKAVTPSETDEPTGDGIIHFLGDSIDATGISGVSVSNSTLAITSAGEYTIDGTLNEGQIVVSTDSSDDEVKLNLDGVTVTNTSDDVLKAKNGKVTLSAVNGNENTFHASADSACAIYSKNDLTIKGDGTIKAISDNGNGIRSKKDLEIGAGDVVVNAGKNGIKGDKSVKITKKNSSVTIVSNGDGIKSDLAPYVDETTGEDVLGGTVTINGGNIKITANNSTASDGTVSTSDGIQADSLLTIAGGIIDITSTGEALKANASSISYLEDSTAEQTPASGDGCIVINGGTITSAAGEDAVKAVKNITINDGSLTITKALEGLQVNEVIYTNSDKTTVLGSVEGEININGGTVNITSTEDGIQCGTGNIVITDGNITINSQQDCIQGEVITNISGGTFDLTAYGGSPAEASDRNPEAANSCKGIKAGKLLNISGGTFNIDTYDDALHSNHTARISGGNITAATGDDGVHADSYLYITDDANINITKSYEGIEAAKLYVQGGETRIVSSDDGANAAGEEPTDSAYTLETAVLSEADLTSDDRAELAAGPGGGSWGGGPNWGGEDSSSYGYLEISGGLLYIEAEGDGFDSNGDGLITGGTVLVNGPTSGGNGVFDIGDNNNKLTVTGGIVIGAGTSDMAVTPTAATNSQYYVVTSSSSSGGGNRPGQGGWGGNTGTSSGFTSQQAGKAFQLTDSQGNVIVTYVPSKTYSWVLVSTPDMTNGTYTLNYGGSVSGGSILGNGSYGLVTGGTYSGTTSTSLSSTQ